MLDSGNELVNRLRGVLSGFFLGVLTGRVFVCDITYQKDVTEGLLSELFEGPGYEVGTLHTPLGNGAQYDRIECSPLLCFFMRFVEAARFVFSALLKKRPHERSFESYSGARIGSFFSRGLCDKKAERLLHSRIPRKKKNIFTASHTCLAVSPPHYHQENRINTRARAARHSALEARPLGHVNRCVSARRRVVGPRSRLQ